LLLAIDAALRIEAKDRPQTVTDFQGLLNAPSTDDTVPHTATRDSAAGKVAEVTTDKPLVRQPLVTPSGAGLPARKKRRGAYLMGNIPGRETQEVLTAEGRRVIALYDLFARSNAENRAVATS
jgi:hypothetical protein